MKVRGRLAPSPTGALHLGNARTFLITWLSVRSRGGSLVMRMEDLDHPKVKPGTAGRARSVLQRLGFDWDEEYIQSQRLDHYRRALDKLIDAGLVYPCTCSRRDVETAQSAPHKEDYGPGYPGTCRGRYDSYAAARRKLPVSRLPAWRFRTPPGTTEFDDGFCGRQMTDVSRVAGDFVLARHPDGAGYQLAVTVDDSEMKINEVLRGDDLLRSTHWQLHIYRALGLPEPEFIHVPLVVGPDGKRLAKRHGDTRIFKMLERGVFPQRIIGLLAWWCGWAEFGEELSLPDLLPRYDLATVPRKPVIADDEVMNLLA